MRRFARFTGLIGLVVLLGGFTTADVTLESQPVLKSGEKITVSAVLTRPEGTGPFPAVVLMQSCGGMLNNTILEDWPKFLADNGYAAIIPRSVYGRGLKNCHSYGSSYLKQTLFPGVMEDTLAALDYLARLPWVDRDRVAMMGFSLGGSVIGEYIGRDLVSFGGNRIKAAITFSGHCNGVLRLRDKRDMPLNIAVPWLVIIGALERESFLRTCGEFRGLPNFTMHVIENAHHSFDIKHNVYLTLDSGGRNKMLYNEEATRTARGLVLAFLDRHLKK